MSEAILAIVMKITMAMAGEADAIVVFAGDAMMHQAQIDAARVAPGKYDYTECFARIKPVIEAADYAVVNLETPLGSSVFTGYPCFNAPVAYAEALKNAGFDMFLTANNHTLDRRDKGLRYTVSALDSLGVSHIGTYMDRQARAGAMPAIRDIKGFKVGFINYTYGTNGIKVQGDVVVDYIDRSLIAVDVAAAREAGAEIVIAAVHWGEEYVLLPVRSQRELADFLVSAGVDAVIGGHPHVVQPIMFKTNSETGRNVPVAYSLGNFLSNMKTRDTRGGALASVKLSRDSCGRAVVSDAYYDYVFTVPPSEGSRNFAVYPVDSVPSQWKAAAQSFLKALK